MQVDGYFLGVNAQEEDCWLIKYGFFKAFWELMLLNHSLLPVGMSSSLVPMPVLTAPLGSV